MGRVVALDLGEKTLGICISDEMQIISIPVENYVFERHNLEQAVDRIESLKEEYKDIELILLGYPLRTDGAKSDATLLIEEYKELLERVAIPIKLVDERYTTQDGIAMLSETIKSKEKIKSLKDVAAAYIMLNDYLGQE